jgi:hypothetical protein
MAVIIVGEELERTKLKLPKGHTKRQKVPAGNSESTTNADPK